MGKITKLIEVECVVCKRKFLKLSEKKVSLGMKGKSYRKSNCKCCSKRCSMDYVKKDYNRKHKKKEDIICILGSLPLLVIMALYLQNIITDATVMKYIFKIGTTNISVLRVIFYLFLKNPRKNKVNKDYKELFDIPNNS